MRLLRRAVVAMHAVVAVSLLVVGCESKQPLVVISTLPIGTIARIGTEVVSGHQLRATATAQHCDADVALATLVDDALLASSARGARLENRQDIVQAIKMVHARHATTSLWLAAQSAATDDEIAEVRTRRWREFERPESVRVVHAVVRRPSTEPASEKLSARLRAAATPLLAVLGAVASPDEFVEQGGIAKKRDGFDVVAQALPAFAIDGRVVESDGEGGMDPAFARAAFELVKPGETSGLVETSFGVHVIRLVERVSKTRASNAEVLARSEFEILRQRGRVRFDEMLGRLRRSRVVSIEQAAESLMEATVKSLVEPQ